MLEGVELDLGPDLQRGMYTLQKKEQKHSKVILVPRSYIVCIPKFMADFLVVRNSHIQSRLFLNPLVKAYFPGSLEFELEGIHFIIISKTSQYIIVKVLSVLVVCPVNSSEIFPDYMEVLSLANSSKIFPDCLMVTLFSSWAYSSQGDHLGLTT